MKNLTFFILCSFVLPTISIAQTFTGGSGAITDNQTIDIPVNVNGLTNSIDTSNFGLETVCLTITHSWDADLTVWIVAPDGTAGLLFSNVGGSDDNFTNTCLNSGVSTLISQASAPFTGTFKPTGQMGIVNNGQNPNGIWYLRVTDGYSGDQGTVQSFSITFGNNPATYFSFNSSNLPIVSINTNGNAIVDEPKVMVDMNIRWHSNGNRNYLTDLPENYDGKIGIEYRGSSSQTIYPKKSYGFETWDVNGNTINAPILNMPSENDWLLIAAYSDKTQFRNEMTYKFWQEMEHYASRGQPVELIIDSVYQGIYYLGEKIKRDANRVAISKLQPTDISGDQLTGGYILKIDKLTGSSSNYWSSAYPAPNNVSNPVNIIVHYPNDSDLVPQQLAYIHEYVDSFETALYGFDFQDTTTGWRKYADEGSFVDYFLITELTRNVDAYRGSCFFYKDKESKGGKLTMGPVWDYDLAFGNADYCDGWKTDDWAYNFNYVCQSDGFFVPFWWEKLIQDTLFQRKLRCRWESLRTTVFSSQHINNYIDSMATLLNESQQRNYTVWPIIGVDVWPNYYVASSYSGEVDTLKWWINKRIDFLDNNLPSVGSCVFLETTNLSLNNIRIYPNPVLDKLIVQLPSGSPQLNYTIFSVDGKMIQYGTVSTSSNHIDSSLLPSGMYTITFDQYVTERFIKQ